MTPAYVYFAEVNVMCMVILTLMVIFVLKSSEKKENRILLANALITMIMTCGGNVFYNITMSRKTVLGIPGIYFSYIFYSISLMAAGCSWLLYTESILETKAFQTKKKRLLVYIPFALIAVLVAATPLTGMFLKVEPNGDGYAVTRAASDGVCFGVMFIYVLIAVLHSWVRAIKEERTMEKKTLFLFGVFPLSLLICGSIQEGFHSFAMQCYGFVICALITYIITQDNKISTDPLTKLNNRNQLNKYMLSEMRNPEIKEHLYLMIFDIDKFKSINDKYGHVEGDKALVKMTDILKKAARNSEIRNFIARFGGDEFIIVTEAWDEVQRIIKKIRELEDEANATKEYPYELSISMGYAKYEINMTGIQQWIDTADEMLYKEKKVKERERKISMR